MFWISSTLSKGSNTRQLRKKAKLREKLEGTTYNISNCFSCWKNCIHSRETKFIFLKNYRKLSGVTEECICELLWEAKPVIIKSRKKEACVTYWNRVFKHCCVGSFFHHEVVCCLLWKLMVLHLAQYWKDLTSCQARLSEERNHKTQWNWEYCEQKVYLFR